MIDLDHDIEMLNYQIKHYQANQYYALKQYYEAIDIYSFLIKREYKIDIMYSNRAACYLHLQKFNLALQDSLSAVESNNNFATAWARVGYSYKALGLHSKAFTAFEIAYSFNKKKIYKNEINFYQNKFSKNTSIINVFNIIKNDKNILDKIKKFKSEIINTNNIFNNNNILDLVENIIDKLK